MEIGEKYLNGNISIAKALEIGERAKLSLRNGEKAIPIALFLNKSDNQQAPKYKGDGIVLWESEKKPEASVPNNGN